MSMAEGTMDLPENDPENAGTIESSEMQGWMMSSKTSTQWAETTKFLCFNVIAGFPEGKFNCPVFGTLHTIDQTVYKLGDYTHRLFEYRGHTYYIRKFYHRTHQDWFYALGLYRRIGEKNGVLSPILMVSQDLSHIIHYDTNGKMTNNEWVMA